MRADHVFFVKKGAFELSKCFIQADESHLGARLGNGPLNLKTGLVKKGDKFEKVAKQGENFIIKNIIGIGNEASV